MRRVVAALLALALLAACAGDDDDAVAEDSVPAPADVGLDEDAATAQAVDEQRAVICSAWGSIVPAAPADRIDDLLELIREDAPTEVLDALAELAVEPRDPAIVEPRLVIAASYIDPLCGTDTAGVLDQLAAPADCLDDDADFDDPGTPLDTTVVDVDLDGTDDTAVLSLLDGGALRLVVSFGVGGQTALRIEDELLFSEGPLRVETAADVDGDGDADLWLVIGSGSSTELYTLILADPCLLTRPLAGDAPNAFSVGASLGNVGGIECVDLDGNGVFDGFHHHRGEAGVDAGTYEGQTLHWVVDGLELVLLDDETFTTGPDDPALRSYGTFDCF